MAQGIVASKRQGRPPASKDGRVDFANGAPGLTYTDEAKPRREKWAARHVLICRMHAAGLKNKEIAEALNITEQYISHVINDPRAPAFVREAVEAMMGNIIDLNAQLKAYSQEALEEIIDQMRSSQSDKIRQTAAFGILDRAGYTPVQRHTIQAAPELPRELADRVSETHIELREIVARTRYGSGNGKTEVKVEEAPE